MRKISPIPVEPKSQKPRLVFASPGGMTALDLPLYPRTEMSDGLRDLRLKHRLSIGDAARRLGIDIVEYSALEQGARTLSAEDLAHVQAALRGEIAEGKSND